MKHAALLSLLLFLFLQLHAQEWEPVDTASRHVLDEVIIKAYEQGRNLKETPAAINYVGEKELNRFSNTSVLPAINATPGVRMEERSPGSYRLSIRGSSLRSPFGVRNVKIYYNGIPFTDPGGHTYFNQLGFYNFQSIEIIKGPGSSIYGAGTGGVMLIESQNKDWRPGFKAGYVGGSYNLSNFNAEVRTGSQEFQNTIRYQHLTSDGYREHTNMRRDVASWDATMQLSVKHKLNAHFLYSDLFYQTPGALTLAEYQANPRADRPSSGFFPGASEARAAIYEQTFLAGFTSQYQFTSRFQNATTLYGAYSQLKNPTIQNYGRSTEPHFGGRTTFKYVFNVGASTLDWLLGGELQQGYTTIKTYKNLNGNPDTLRTDDEFTNRQYFGFTQLSWQHRKWVITGGLSLNRQKLVFIRLNNHPYTEMIREFDNQLAPRIAVLYKITPDVSVYANVAKGFSPPTTAELLPSGGGFNLALNAEEGWNYELGSKGYFFDRRLNYDISAFLFKLGNTIVVRRDAGGGNFFVNAGSTQQAGVETYLNYQLLRNKGKFFGPLNIWTSYSYYHFRYEEFMQLEFDFSGNKLPSIAPHTLTAGLDLYTRPGIYLNITHNYTDQIPLDDANMVFADSYNLLGLRLGYKHEFSNRYMLEIFAGADNLLDEQYSLGNDINGFSGRYYNPAPGRNYFGGITVGYSK